MARYLSASPRRVLLVDADDERGASLERLLNGERVAVDRVRVPDEALAAMETATTEPSLLVLSGSYKPSTLSLFESQNDDALSAIPLVVYAPDLSAEQEANIERLALRGRVRCARSTDRLFDEVSLCLHRRISQDDHRPAGDPRAIVSIQRWAPGQEGADRR